MRRREVTECQVKKHEIQPADSARRSDRFAACFGGALLHSAICVKQRARSDHCHADWCNRFVGSAQVSLGARSKDGMTQKAVFGANLQRYDCWFPEAALE